MKSLFLVSLLFATSVSTQEKTAVEQRFSQDALRALTTSGDMAIFPLSGHRPNPVYDEKAKLLDVKPILIWLQKQQVDSRPLAVAKMDQLRALVLSPKNHQSGLFAVVEPTSSAVFFTSSGKQGFIVLGYSLVSIFWDGRMETALLNDTGVKELQKWIKTNG